MNYCVWVVVVLAGRGHVGTASERNFTVVDISGVIDSRIPAVFHLKNQVQVLMVTGCTYTGFTKVSQVSLIKSFKDI